MSKDHWQNYTSKKKEEEEEAAKAVSWDQEVEVR